MQGSGFNWVAPDHFRMVFLPNVDDLGEAVGRIERFLAHYRKRHAAARSGGPDGRPRDDNSSLRCPQVLARSSSERRLTIHSFFRGWKRRRRIDSLPWVPTRAPSGPMGRFQPRTEGGSRLDVCQNPVMRPSLALHSKRNEVLALAAARGASRVRVFGSVASGLDNEDSDLDLLIDVPKGTSLLHIVGLQLAIQDVLGVKVDLCTERELHPDLRQRIVAQAKPL